MITSKEIIVKIDEALKEFGEYSYHDKGAREVMDIGEIHNALKDMPHDQILNVLKEVEANHRDPCCFLQDIVYAFQEDPDVDDLFDSELFQEYY